MAQFLGDIDFLPEMVWRCLVAGLAALGHRDEWAVRMPAGARVGLSVRGERQDLCQLLLRSRAGTSAQAQ
jgi:hypothetical protein